MLRAPATDPNLWTEITNHYHIVRIPSYPGGCCANNVDTPGYMMNYGTGRVLTAEMRQHMARLWAFDTGDLRWYGGYRNTYCATGRSATREP